MAGSFGGGVALLILYSFDSLIFTHGLRQNNMDAALVLAYAGAVYHFLRWADESAVRASWRHALAVGLYFLLGFMTKFVAALFLLMVLGAAALELNSVRDKVRRDWRTWGMVAVVVTILIAPWFIYQTLQPDRQVWQVMLGSHVYQRFNGWLDPAHLRPWHYYFTDLFGQMTAAGTWSVVLAGGLLIHARVLRERWLEGTVALYWIYLPFVLMSIGTSKLRHYTYPFLPPVALAGGYFMASAANAIVSVAAARPPAWVSRIARTTRVDRVIARGRAAVTAMTGGGSFYRRDALRVWRVAALIAAAGFLVLAAIAVVYPRRIRLSGLLIVRDPSVWRPCLAAMALGLLAGRARWTMRLAVPLILLTALPIAWYSTALERVTMGDHPLRTSRDCIESVRDEERAAGRAAPGMFVVLPGGFYLHTYFFYYRHLGWDRHDEVSDVDLLRMLDTPGEQRPVLMPRERFLAIRAAHDRPGVVRPLIQVDNVVALMPGPYAKCGF